MKPKILIVKHFDHVILAGLALLLLFAVYKSFIASDQTVTELTEGIDRYAKTIERELIDRDKPDLPVTDYRAALELRFERPAVIDPYSRDPFFPEPDILVGRPLLTIDQTEKFTLDKVRIFAHVQSQDLVKVEYVYDEEENKSVVSITGVREGSTDVRLRDTLERTYLWRCNVVRVSKPPYAPDSCLFRPMPPVLKEGELVRTARVLVSFLPRYPEPTDDEYGITTQSYVYRKRSDQLDADYQLITTPALRPASQAEINAIWEKFLEPQEELPGTENVTENPVSGLPTGNNEVYIPRVADAPAPVLGQARLPAAGARRGSTTRTVEGAKPLDGAYVFLDTQVEPGETYIYKIVTVSEIEKGEAVLCKDPFISDPVTVPSLISFDVVRISTTGVRVAITTPHPDTGQLVTEEFNIIPGMSIHGIIRRTRTIEIKFPDGRVVTQRVPEVIEFSTNTVLVDTLSVLKEFEYRLDVKIENGKPVLTYQAKPVTDKALLYLTQRGALRWKTEKEDDADIKRGSGGIPSGLQLPGGSGGLRLPSNNGPIGLPGGPR